MTEPTRDALHARTLEMLQEEAREYGTRMKSAYPEERAALAEEYAYAAECVQRVPELEAEVASHTAYKLSLLDALGPGVEGRSVPDAIRALRAKAEIVDAMERGEIELHRADLHAPGEPRTQWVCVNTTTHFGYRGTTARDALAAYAAATREGADG